MALEWRLGLSAAQILVGLGVMVALPKSLTPPAKITALAISAIVAGQGANSAKKLRSQYLDVERAQDMLHILKDAQAEQQLEMIESASQRKLHSQRADENMERQLAMLEATAPLFQQVLQMTSSDGSIAQMAIGMLQKGESLGDVLIATADASQQLALAEVQMKQQQAQMQMQAQMQATAIHQAQPVASVAPEVLPPEDPTVRKIMSAANTVGLQGFTYSHKLSAPSFCRQVFNFPVANYKKQSEFAKALAISLGKSEVPLMVAGEEKLAVDFALDDSERKFYDFPRKEWVQGERVLYLGQGLDGEVKIDLAHEDTPQILIAGTTGSGKSTTLRCIAYCLLMQGAKVVMCGGKESDFEDFSPLGLKMLPLEDTYSAIALLHDELEARKGWSKQQLDSAQPIFLGIDEYKGTVPFDAKECKQYDNMLANIIRLGRGLKIHVAIGLQHPSKRGTEDPQGLPPDIRSNLPCRICFRVVDSVAGRMALSRDGNVAPTLSGRGDGIIQFGTTNTRFQAYKLGGLR